MDQQQQDEKSSPRISSVAVYCGSNSGTDPLYARAAACLGRTLAERGLRLVYGGGHVGLMGTVADAVTQHGRLADWTPVTVNKWLDRTDR